MAGWVEVGSPSCNRGVVVKCRFIRSTTGANKGAIIIDVDIVWIDILCFNDI